MGSVRKRGIYREKREKISRMSLMTLLGTPTSFEPSLHDVMFAPMVSRTRCGSGGLARRHCRGSRLDVVEHSDKYELIVDAPGLSPGDIHVKLEVRETKEDSAGKVIYSERRRSDFARRFSLPDDADESSIHAKQKDGVVTISIGKAAPSEPHVRHIPIVNGS